jgi:phospholipid/cholesterol/gamma-HCH transport system ATP-binding protein
VSEIESGKGVRIEVRDLWKSYGDHTVLRGVSLAIEPGETLVIIGGSGEGKSVLIRQIIGLERPDRGEVRLGETSVEEYLALPIEKKPFRMAMVFQMSALLNSLTVGENVSLALREHRLAKPAEIREIVADALAEVDMEGTEAKMPGELSGGMRKRVAIARALAMRSEVILYDEPTAELDPILTEEIGQLIRKIQAHRRPTQVVVTHNMPLAREIADHVAVLKQGEVVDYTTGEAMLESGNDRTREFLRAARILGPDAIANHERQGSRKEDAR